MASTYTGLGVELMATGENAGTWGTKTNTNLQHYGTNCWWLYRSSFNMLLDSGATLQLYLFLMDQQELLLQVDVLL